MVQKFLRTSLIIAGIGFLLTSGMSDGYASARSIKEELFSGGGSPRRATPQIGGRDPGKILELWKSLEEFNKRSIAESADRERRNEERRERGDYTSHPE